MNGFDAEHLQRALQAQRFVEADAEVLAQRIVGEMGPSKTARSVHAYRQARDHFATLDATCELAACLLSEQLNAGGGGRTRPRSAPYPD